ncbi:unnamed protein product, partial [Scytosiphon promiscuus]
VAEAEKPLSCITSTPEQAPALGIHSPRSVPCSREGEVELWTASLISTVLRSAGLIQVPCVLPYFRICLASGIGCEPAVWSDEKVGNVGCLRCMAGAGTRSLLDCGSCGPRASTIRGDQRLPVPPSRKPAVRGEPPDIIVADTKMLQASSTLSATYGGAQRRRRRRRRRQEKEIIAVWFASVRGGRSFVVAIQSGIGGSSGVGNGGGGQGRFQATSRVSPTAFVRDGGSECATSSSSENGCGCPSRVLFQGKGRRHHDHIG